MAFGKRAEGSGIPINIVITIVLLFAIVLVAITVFKLSDNAYEMFIETITKPFAWLFGEDDDIPPEVTLYACVEKGTGKHICVVSDDKMKERCLDESVRKYAFSYEDEWIDCENEACLKNYPDLLIQGTVMFIPVNNKWTQTMMVEGIDRNILNTIYDTKIRTYTPTSGIAPLTNCLGGSQLKMVVVEETCTINPSIAEPLCYNEVNALTQLLNCAAEHTTLENVLIIGIDDKNFAMEPGCINPSSTTHVSDRQVILVKEAAGGMIPGNEWNSMLARSVVNKPCIEIRPHIPLSEQFDVCDQELLEGKI